MITNNEYKVLSAIPKCIKNVNGHDVAHEDDVISNVTCSEAISEVEAAAAFSNLEIRSLIELPDLGRHEYSITSDGHIAISEYEDNERQKKDEELQAALVRDRENEARNLYSPPQLTYAEGALLDCIMTIFINRQGKNGGIPWIPIGDIKVNMDNHLALKITKCQKLPFL